MTKLTATQQPDGGWYLWCADRNIGFRGKTIDEALDELPVMDGERVTIEIGYLKISELKDNYADQK